MSELLILLLWGGFPDHPDRPLTDQEIWAMQPPEVHEQSERVELLRKRQQEELARATTAQMIYGNTDDPDEIHAH